MGSYLAILAIALLVYMNGWFVVSLIKKRNDVADIAWGLGFVMLAWLSLLLVGTAAGPQWLVMGLVTVWGGRLAWHIWARHRRKEEDARYRQWRLTWGKWFYIRSYGQIYLLQGLLLYVIALPVLIINYQTNLVWSWWIGAGLIVWMIGFFFEVVGDWQLAHFLAQPANRGHLMTSGLWAYSRHPNYFGEATQWWGIWLMACSAPYGWLTVVGPITITFLLLKVSGVPMLERSLAEHPDFPAYRQRTRVFVPWFPKAEGGG